MLTGKINIFNIHMPLCFMYYFPHISVFIKIFLNTVDNSTHEINQSFPNIVESYIAYYVPDTVLAILKFLTR